MAAGGLTLPRFWYEWSTTGRLDATNAATADTTSAQYARTYHPTTGKLTSIATSDVTLTYTHDGPLLTDVMMTGAVAGSVHREYDSSFRIASETVNGGAPVTFGYDKDDLLTSAATTVPRPDGGTAIPVVLELQRSPTTGFVDGGSMTIDGQLYTEERTYNTYGEGQSYAAKFDGGVVYSVDYGTRDALGRIKGKTETVDGTTTRHGYRYDERARLDQVKKFDAVDGNV